MKDNLFPHETVAQSEEPAAAVAIIRSNAPTTSVLLLRRAQSLQDPWSGHYAFPGGRRENGDASILDTCVREVREETGIELVPEYLRMRLALAFAGRNVEAPILVQPYLFEIGSRPEVVVETSEIESFTWLDIQAFRNLDLHFHAEPLPGKFRPVFPIEDYYVWGFTYQVLCSVLGVESPS
jgi:8-oxo-dGTP pyrophosphatase MutT (NUDIX family)